MLYKIQSLVFPTEEKHQQSRKLFYKGDYGILDIDKKRLAMSRGQKCDFITYINACSWQKWQKYTSATNVSVTIDIKGEVELLFAGYTKDALIVDRQSFERKTIKTSGREKITFTFPDNNCQMIGFEVVALNNAVIYGGYYSVEIKKKDMQDVILSIATTTCKKEEFIKKNISLISEELLSGNDDLSKNLYLHVVDNGRTLFESDINGKHIYLHPNINSGGSGGFARGMMESLHQNPAATHVLLMDDDVLVLPESIRRTFNLLRLLKPEYREHFISGAMLYYEDPLKQHEDVGSVKNLGNDYCFVSTKGVLDQSKISDALENERIMYKHKNAHAAWWYCCIPAKVIKREGLPLPIFIRCDDIEYSLRCRANFITMNGICVWHMGFATKFNTVFDKYQQHRNISIAQSTSGVLPEINMLSVFYNSFRVEMLRFNYDAAQLIIESLEDYAKGPDFIMNNDSGEVTLSKFKLNEKMLPLADLLDEIDFNIQECSMDSKPRLIDRVILKLTWNGQRFTPKSWERNGAVPISFDRNIQPNKIVLRNKLLAINPYACTGAFRVKDKKRFKELMHKYRSVSKYYKKHKEEIGLSYKEKFSEMTSENFWCKYLGIPKYEK